MFAAKKIQPDDTLVVFCDSSRFAKTIWISLHHLLSFSQKDIYSYVFSFAHQKSAQTTFVHKNLKVIPFDFSHTSKEDVTRQTFATLLDVMSLYDEGLDEMNVRQRKKDFKIQDMA